MNRLLAQLADPGVTDLPSPPLLQRWVLESPLPTAAVLVIAAAFTFIVMSRRGRGRAGAKWGGGLVVAAAAVLAAGSAVTTQREIVLNRTRQLIHALATADSARVDAMLAPQVTLHLLGSRWNPPRQEIIDRVESDLGGRYRVESHRITTLNAVIDSAVAARSTCRVAATVEGSLYNAPTGSNWLLGWSRSANGPWLVDTIECLHIDGVPDNADIRP